MAKLLGSGKDKFIIIFNNLSFNETNYFKSAQFCWE